MAIFTTTCRDKCRNPVFSQFSASQSRHFVAIIVGIPNFLAESPMNHDITHKIAGPTKKPLISVHIQTECPCHCPDS